MKYQIKGITEEEIEKTLKDNFTINFKKVSFKPIGTGSWLYDVYDEEGKHYLLKLNNDISEDLIRTLVYIDNQPNIETLDFVQTVDNKYVFKVNSHKCVLYEYIEGKIVGRENLTSEEWGAIGKKLGVLHKIRLSEELKDKLYEERFIRCRKRAERVVNAAKEQEQEEAVQKELAVFIKTSLEAINEHFKKTRELKSKLLNLPLVVTHGDAHPWNVVKNNGFRFIDWDGLGIALPERDLMHYYDKNIWEDVLAGYKEVNSEFSVDKNAINYYQHEWVLQEIADYGEKILLEDISEKDKEDALKELSEYF